MPQIYRLLLKIISKKIYAKLRIKFKISQLSKIIIPGFT